jgi:hypothetical protein
MNSGLLISHDILDLGTRKSDLQRSRRPLDSDLSASLVLGTPGQFDVPNVQDVSGMKRL